MNFQPTERVKDVSDIIKFGLSKCSRMTASSVENFKICSLINIIVISIIYVFISMFISNVTYIWVGSGYRGK